jgi:hypothetical protein
MVLFLIYHFVGQNDILKFIYCSMILFSIYIEAFFTVNTLESGSAIMLSF